VLGYHVHQWVSGVEWYWRSPECDVSTLCTTPAKGMHPGHTVNIIHSYNTKELTAAPTNRAVHLASRCLLHSVWHTCVLYTTS
jgi:hypothetical protein